MVTHKSNLYSLKLWDRDGVVGIATRYGVDGPGIESWWGARFSAPVQTGPGSHPASCTMGTGPFPRVKWPGRDADPPPPLPLLLLLILVTRQYGIEISFKCVEFTPTFVKIGRLAQKSKWDAPINAWQGDARSLHLSFW